MNPARRLPAEWEPSEAVILSWPHEQTDWASMLADVQKCFLEIAKAITEEMQLIVVAPDVDKPRRQLEDLPQGRISYYQMSTNDTWARDFGPITVIDGGSPLLLDFKFNGWGLKFPACYDNLITLRLSGMGAFSRPLENHLGFVLEGGSIESDGKGTILTTAECLTSPNRNGGMNYDEICAYLRVAFGAERILTLHHGALEGDDTDGHIDTLARFAPGDTILYIKCDDPDDSHYESLQLMEEELMALRTVDGQPYNLIALPWPDAVYDEDGQRLPATYANFLITPNSILLPVYGQPRKDLLASQIMRIAFPDREIKMIDCSPLIRQHGSLHCVTMQLPCGVLSK